MLPYTLSSLQDIGVSYSKGYISSQDSSFHSKMTLVSQPEHETKKLEAKMKEN